MIKKRSAVELIRVQWDRVLGVVLVAAGGIALYLGYHGVATSAYVPQALAYLASGGAGGLALVCLGATAFISADLRDEWRKVDALEAAIRDAGCLPTIHDTPAPPGPTPPTLASAPARGAERPEPVAFRVLTPVVGLAGAGLLALGWNQAASQADTARSVGGLTVSILAVALISAAGGLGTLGYRRTARSRRAALLAPLFDGFPALARDTATPTSDGRLGRVLVDSSGVGHAAGCPALPDGTGAPSSAFGVPRCQLCLADGAGTDEPGV